MCVTELLEPKLREKLAEKTTVWLLGGYVSLKRQGNDCKIAVACSSSVQIENTIPTKKAKKPKQSPVAMQSTPTQDDISSVLTNFPDEIELDFTKE